MLKLCKLDDIPDGEARGFCVEGPNLAQRLMIIRQGATALGYVDYCPHTGSRLDPGRNTFMNDDGKHLRCSIHGALFRIQSGECIDGPCFGDKLHPCPVSIKNGEIYLERDNVEIVDELTQWMSDLEPKDSE
jgi:nitrite reductase/ring-hydroxylating ferredoxin subunit